MTEDLILGGKDTLVILMANFNYRPGTGYPNLNHARPSYQKLKALLTNKNVTGIDPPYVIDILDKTMDESWKQLTNAFEKELRKEYRKLLFYFIGHGSVRGDNDLFLASVDTFQHDVKREAIRYSHIVEWMSGLRHIKNKMIVLDCCRSGRGGDFKGGEEHYQHYFEHQELKLSGTYFIGASSSSQPAGSGIDAGQEATEFTAAFMKVLSSGTEAEPVKIIQSNTFEAMLSAELTSFPPVFKNRISNLFFTGIDFPFYYNQKFNIDFVRHCIEHERYRKAEEFLLNILAEEKYQVTPAAKDTYRLLMETLLDKKSWKEAGALLLNAIHKVGRANPLVDLTKHEDHHRVAQQASVYMIAEDYIEAKVLYELLLKIDPHNGTYDFALRQVDDAIEARDQGTDKPNILQFSASPKAVVSGAALKLQWKVENMRYLEITQEPGGEPQRFTKKMDEQPYLILESTKFKLVATNFHDKTSERMIYVRAFQPPLFKNRPVPIPVYRQTSQVNIPDLKQILIDLHVKLPFKSPPGGNSATEISPLNSRTLYHLYERIKNKFRRY